MMLLDLFLCFLQVGLFSVGGGMVAITLLFQQVVAQRGWLDATAFNDLIAIAESTPGPIAVNAATFVGMKLGGVPGALLATLATILPGCVVSLLLAALYMRYREHALMKGMLDGLRPVIVGLIFMGGFTVLRTALWHGAALLPANMDWISAALFAASIVLLRKTKISPVALMLGAGAVGCAARLMSGS